MDTEDRFSELLLRALTPSDGARPKRMEDRSVDTSCPHVPFGFVRTMSMQLAAGHEPDEFWAYAVSQDDFVDPLTATIQSLDVSRLKAVFTTIRKDLERVGGQEAVAEFGESPVQALAVERGCQHCCGQVLLMRYTDTANYVHWHRES